MHSTKAYFGKYEVLMRAMVEATGALVKTTEEYSSKLNDIQEALGACVRAGAWACGRGPVFRRRAIPAAPCTCVSAAHVSSSSLSLSVCGQCVCDTAPQGTAQCSNQLILEHTNL